MVTKHLSVGSENPPMTEGLLRVYSMRFCPFAQRALLVLKDKKIPHDVVNVNLINKPEWILKINPKGQVPTLIDGTKVVTESLDIADYLDEKYPEHPLYPADPSAKAADKEFIQKAGVVIKVFFDCLFGSEQKTPEEWSKLFVEASQVWEDELARRGTPYFFGDRPGMIDFMLWPWAERSDCLSLKLGQKLPLKDTDIPLVRQWKKNMMKHPVCQELYISGERFWQAAKAKLEGKVPAYDEI